jgi:hypothetical protein
MKKIYKIIFVIISSVFLNTLNATEGGGGSYPNGIETEMSGVLPPKGWYFINYTTQYKADKVNNANGNTINDNLGLTARANSFRFMNMTDKKVFGGDYHFTFVLPLVDIEATGIPSAAGNKDSGLGDIAIVPIAISWPGKEFYQKAGLEFVLPTGSYDKTKAINIGRNVVTTTAFYGATYLKNDWTASGFFKYDINQENDDTQIKSGDEFHVDFSLGKYFGKPASPITKEWLVNIGGYYYQQVTGDSGSGNTKGSNKGKVVAIGPELNYSYKNMIFMLKHHIETESENRSQGSMSTLKFVYSF